MFVVESCYLLPMSYPYPNLPVRVGKIVLPFSFSAVIVFVAGTYRTTFAFYNTYILLGTNPLVAMKSGIEPLYLVALTA